MNIVNFIKNWTPPRVYRHGYRGLSHFCPSSLPLTDSPRKPSLSLRRSSPCLCLCVLFVTFCKVDFRKMRPVAWHWWVAVFQVLCVVAVMAAILALGLHGRTLVLAEALLTCIISPCASAAPVVTQKLGGNLEEMTTYTFLSNFITALLIPICFPMLDEGADIGFITAFSLILYKVFTVLVIPMLLAYIVKHYMHGLCRRIVSVKDLSYYLWGCSLLIVSGTTMKNILHAQTSVSFLPPHSPPLPRALPLPVRLRSCHWQTLRCYGQCWSGIGSEEHCLRHLDSLHLSLATLLRRSRLLHPLAEHHQ